MKWNVGWQCRLPARILPGVSDVHSHQGTGKADDDQLVKVQEDVTAFLDAHENVMGGDLVTGMCLLREAAAREQKRRGEQTQVTHLRAKHASSQRIASWVHGRAQRQSVLNALGSPDVLA
jgi:hypothetical protein